MNAIPQLAPRLRPLRVLSVEDPPIQRKLIEACMQVVGAECILACDGAEAVTLFRSAPVDIVLLDMNLPHVDGLAAFEQMRSTPGRKAKTPILAVTLNEHGWDADEYRRRGFDGLYLKPLEPSRLYSAIDSVLIHAGQPPLFGSGGRARIGAHVA